MFLKEHNISVRLPQEKTIDTGIVFVQNDKDVYKLNIRVFDGVYEIDYTEVEEATITFLKRDNNVVQGNMAVEADHLSYTLGTNEIATPGKLLASIQLLGANERLTTARFLFRVEKDLITEDAVKSTSEFAILQRLKEELEAIDVVDLTNQFNAHKANSAPHPEANFATKNYVQSNTMFIFPQSLPITDANLDLTDGIYPVGSTLKNGPYAEYVGDNQGMLIVIRWQFGLNYRIQIHVSVYSGSIHVRLKSVWGEWTPWRKIINSGVLMSGNGSPEGVVTAPVGTLYRRTDGGASSTLYVKESGTGNTGWKAVQTI